MNNFNKILVLVQNHCHDHHEICSEEKFEKIAGEAGVSLERLHFYLDCLQDIGLIRYIQDGRKISLTSKGVKAKYVFPN
jgi:predicted transcriptional regulator